MDKQKKAGSDREDAGRSTAHERHPRQTLGRQGLSISERQLQTVWKLYALGLTSLVTSGAHCTAGCSFPPRRQLEAWGLDANLGAFQICLMRPPESGTYYLWTSSMNCCL